MKSKAAFNRVAATTANSVGTQVTAPEESDSIEETGEWVDQKASSQALRAAKARQLSGRRRFVDPTTCEREYTIAEMEFMQAMQDYKASSGRMFPTWSEVLEVLQALGYEKQAPPGEIPNVPEAAAPKRSHTNPSAVENHARFIANAG